MSRPDSPRKTFAEEFPRCTGTIIFVFRHHMCPSLLIPDDVIANTRYRLFIGLCYFNVGPAY